MNDNFSELKLVDYLFNKIFRKMSFQKVSYNPFKGKKRKNARVDH